MDYIDNDNLIGDKYRTVILCEYANEISLIRQLIDLVDSAIQKKTTNQSDSYEGICYLFAKSIVEYSKMAYDNLLLGHFNATNMIIRAKIENIVCLDIIINDERKELWKYYIVHSYKNTIMKLHKSLPAKEEKILEEMYWEYGITPDFYEKETKKKAYIDIDYGWTYKINKQFNFSGICKLVDERIYKDFKIMSDFSHGTAIHLKIGGLSSIDDIMNMISSIYFGIYRLVAMYCWESVNKKFYEVAEQIEDIINAYLDESVRKGFSNN